LKFEVIFRPSIGPSKSDSRGAQAVRRSFRNGRNFLGSTRRNLLRIFKIIVTDGKGRRGNDMRSSIAICIAWTVGFWATSAFAAEYVLNVTATSGQTSRYEDGRETIVDTGAAATVKILEPKAPTPKQSGFRIYVLNAGDSPFNFGPENIRVKIGEVSYAMLSYGDLLRKQKKREAWQAVAMGFAAAGRNMQASQAGYNYGTATYTGQTYGTVGATPYTANTFGTGTYSGYNAGAAFAAQSIADQQNRRDMQDMMLNQAAARAELDQLMKTTTIDPGQVFGGIVQYMMPVEVQRSKVPVPVSIEITAGSEIHVFHATLGTDKAQRLSK